MQPLQEPHRASCGLHAAHAFSSTSLRRLSLWSTADAQGEVMVGFTTPSVRSRAGPRVAVSAQPLRYERRMAPACVVTTAAEVL